MRGCGRVEVLEGVAHVQRCECGRQQHRRCQHDQHDVQDVRQRAVALGLAALGVELRQHLDEGGGRDAADQQVADRVGQLERAGIGINLRAGSKQVGDQRAPHKAEHA